MEKDKVEQAGLRLLEGQAAIFNRVVSVGYVEKEASEQIPERVEGVSPVAI